MPEVAERRSRKEVFWLAIHGYVLACGGSLDGVGHVKVDAAAIVDQALGDLLDERDEARAEVALLREQPA